MKWYIKLVTCGTLDGLWEIFLEELFNNDEDDDDNDEDDGDDDGRSVKQ